MLVDPSFKEEENHTRKQERNTNTHIALSHLECFANFSVYNNSDVADFPF